MPDQGYEPGSNKPSNYLIDYDDFGSTVLVSVKRNFLAPQITWKAAINLCLVTSFITFPFLIKIVYVFHVTTQRKYKN